MIKFICHFIFCDYVIYNIIYYITWWFNSDEDEIIECDGCGILVHEGCYGTIEDDSRSVHSDLSTESTEPWFCDACKAGITQPVSTCIRNLRLNQYQLSVRFGKRFIKDVALNLQDYFFAESLKSYA